MQNQDFKVFGLDCAEEVQLLRKAVGALPGVSALDFDVLNAKMRVSYDDATSSREALIQAVGTTGMRAILWEERHAPPLESFWQRSGRTIMVCSSGTLLMLGFVSHWIMGKSLIGALSSGEGGVEHLPPLVSILLYGGAVISGGWFVFPKALGAARRLRPDMNFLMVVAIIGAIVIGEWFEAATVAFLFAVALVLEHWSVDRARRAVSALMELSPTTARYLCPNDGDIMEKPVEEVPVGVTVLVRPGEKIPLDGVVTRGNSTVNQAPITGESIPVPKCLDSEVFAGTINEDGALEFRNTKPANDTTLARIIHLVQDAQSRRAASGQWVETFARYYTPIMLALAIGVVVLPPLALSAPWMTWLYRGLVILVIACPCALVISTPVSIVSGLTAAARNGVLVKGGIYLEAAGRLRAVALDKTGTLTRGQPEVQKVIPLNGHTMAELLATAAAMEAQSEHPLARAILRRAHAGKKIAAQPAEGFRAMKGKGAEAQIGGRRFWIGSHRLMEEEGHETPAIHEMADALERAGHSVVAVGNDEHVCGLIAIADSVRENARDVVRAMHGDGIQRVVMLTGDNRGTAEAVALATGVDEALAELLPEDKVAAVESLVKRYRQVAMVGDGVNDAPAMAVATVGVAMGAMGTDAAIETADIALMADDLSKLPWLIRHSRRTLGIIKQNIVFALGLKFAFVGLTMLGMATLWMAIAADMGASFLVIFNSLRLLGKSPQ